VSKVTRVVFLRSNPIDPDPRLAKSATSLVKAGYDVTALGWDRFGNSPPSEGFGGVRIVRLVIRAAYGTGMQNLPALIRWQWGATRWLFRYRRQFDVLHACDFDTVIPALLMKLLFGKKVIYDIYDFYADHLRSTPAWIKGLIRYVDKRCIGWVDGVILVDDVRREQIAGTKPKRLAVIYNVPQDQNLEALVTVDEDPWKSGFFLVYVGLLQVERGLLEIIKVLERHPDWSLDLAGFGGDEATIQGRTKGLRNVRWHGRISYQHALEISSRADVLFATYDPAIENHRFASPNKVFEAMMLGKPIVVARNTNVDLLIERFQCGLVVDYGDVAGLERALTSLYEDHELQSRLGQNARQAYESTYNWVEMETRLLNLYTSLQT
jgi:glycosyltransferase involved in cell wall biosynthesis